jgi:hypothetical protein
MHVCQAPYRQLYEDLLDYSGACAYQDVLAPWVESHREEVKWLRAFGKRTGDPFPWAPPFLQATIEDRWRLYALSRVNQLLMLRFQHGDADQSDYQGPESSIAGYRRFAETLGMEVVSAGRFSPFYNEIVTAEPAANPGAPLTLTAEYWPALMLGSMMFSRAGVGVSGGEKLMLPGIAVSSTLYWALWRKNRPYNDLSHGWGSNSQWRTSFRRDYHIGGRLYFNVDGEYDLAKCHRRRGGEDDLTLAERIELLMHRCFIKTAKPHDDLWPYDDRYSVPIN